MVNSVWPCQLLDGPVRSMEICLYGELTLEAIGKTGGLSAAV